MGSANSTNARQEANCAIVHASHARRVSTLTDALRAATARALDAEMELRISRLYSGTPDTPRT